MKLLETSVFYAYPLLNRPKTMFIRLFKTINHHLTKKNTNIKKLTGILFLVLLVAHGNAQELLGLTMGNYKGIAGNMVNPAGMTTNKVYLDINLVSVDMFFRNNIGYLPKEDFVIWDMFKSGYTYPTYGDDKNNLLFQENSKLKNATVNARILGPSVMLQVGDHGFGITTGVRYLLTGNRIPWDIAMFAQKGLDYSPMQNIEFDDYDTDFGTSAWMEIGLSYAYNVWKSYDRQLTLGISVKKLWGYAGGYMVANNVNYIVPDDSTINIQNLNAEIGYSLPIDYDDTDFSGSPLFRGSGVGLDIGAVFVMKKEVDINKWRGGKLCSQKYTDYLYKVGVSILDIGRVKYTDNAQLHSYDNVAKYWSSIDTIQFNNLNSFIQGVSNTLYGDPNASLVSNSIKVGLPTALSVQADINLQKNIYIAGFWIHPLRINKNTLRRPAQLAVIPRFETKYLEMSIPISIYEYKYPRVGFAARFYFFTIGTERLGTYLGMADMNGLDIYASIKIGFNKGSCKKLFGGACDNNDFGNKYSKKKGW